MSMGSDENQTLRIDPEFSGLIVPLSRKEYDVLEQSIRKDGCREPIIVWKNTIVDGHNRYRICNRWGIPFRIRRLGFADRDEAIAWICDIQLSRKNISEENRRYLIGRQYDAERKIHKRNPWMAGTFCNLKDSGYHAEFCKETEQESMLKPTVVKAVTEKHHLSHPTAQKYASYSRALDSIGRKTPFLFQMIRSGTYVISQENVIALSRLDAASLQRIRSCLEARSKDTQKTYIRILAEEITVCFRDDHAPELHPQIKNMPAYDPDAEVNGLALTIQTWINSVSKVNKNAGLGTASLESRKRLELVLSELTENVRTLMRTIRSVDDDN